MSRKKDIGEAWERTRAKTLNARAVNEDGSHTITMTPDVQAVLERQHEAFKQKFGRDPAPGEPIFFDPDADTPTPISQGKALRHVAEAAVKNGLDTGVVIARFFGPDGLEDYRKQH